MGFVDERNHMVDSQLASRGICDPRVLDAFRTVPREAFVPASLAALAYRDMSLPIDGEHSLPPPYIAAAVIEALLLGHGERVLEIGTGSGYGAAVLSHVAEEVFTVERRAAAADVARVRLARLGYHNIHVLHGDDTLGWPEHAPYDAIVVAAGGPEVSQTLLAQLRVDGRLVKATRSTRAASPPSGSDKPNGHLS